MTHVAEAAERDFLDIIFGPATQAQTYLNIVYLLLAFPLGIAYFIFLTTGLSLAVGLLVIVIGFPILFFMLLACRGFGAFERMMARSMLHMNIPPPPDLPSVPGLWPKFKAVFGSTATWKSFAYLLLKFPFGILAFVVVVTGFALSIGLILAPFLYGTAPVNFGLWQVDSKDEAAVWCLIGVVLLILSMHLINAMAKVWGRFAQIMLGPDDPVPVTPSR